MAETIEKAKKAKAPAKPRAAATSTKTTAKPAAKKQTVAEKVKATTPTHEEIAELARRTGRSAATTMARPSRTGCGRNVS